MRPEALEIEGFTAFREKTPRIEFGDAELFALTGPTGAGKSSLIDAMIFVLYGSVPRLGATPVEPVISKGKQEARIRLDFTLADQHYTAVRVVRRTSTGGATTKEARLESGAEVLAATVKELNEQVLALIGLDFEQFTTCVALPQGEFARFLKQTPGDRQKLLSQLLGLDVYKRVRAEAVAAQKVALAQIQLLNAQLEVLASVTKSAVQERKKRLEALQRLSAIATKRFPELKKLHEDLNKTQLEEKEARIQIDALAAVRTPETVKHLGKEAAAVKERLTQAEKKLGTAEDQVRKLKEHLTALGDPIAFHALRTRYADRGLLAAAVGETRGSAEAAAELAAKQAAALEKAKTAEQTARVALDRAQRHHSAHTLRGHLAIGEPCPVCGQDVAQVPDGEMPAALDELEEALEKRQSQLADDRERHIEYVESHSAADGVWKSKQTELEKLEAFLNAKRPLPEVEKRIADIEAVTKKLEVAEQVRDNAKEAASEVATAMDQTQSREKMEWKEYHRVRDGLAALSPPKPDTGLVQAWADLEVWAQAQNPTLQQERATLVKRAEELERHRRKLETSLAKAFVERDVAYGDDAEINLATAVSKGESDLDDVRKKLKEKRDHKKQAKAAKRQADVAYELAGHLDAKGFERWLLAAAFDELVAGASRRLQELSNGQYTFHRNDKFEFDVVDHGNAGETRSAKTLSGGETFLASLALALALSEHIANLAAKGTARLESMFLDEGFGTLDGETLDTVAAAIEELSTRGRMVGIVTHVADLAERIPVRFNVSKTAASAQVERVAT